MKEGIVENYMTKSPVVINSSATLKEAWELLEEKKFKHLPVINENSEVCGILSETDIRHLKTLFTHISSEFSTFTINLTVKDVMTARVTTIAKEVTVEDANDLLLSKGFHCLPVTEDGHIIGIISETDILHYYNDKYSS